MTENFESKPVTGPKDFFLYLAGMVTLYVSVGSLIGLVMETINRMFPDRLEYYVDPYSTGIRMAIASLLVIFPLFVVITKYLNKDLGQNPDKKNLAIRKWIAYLTLFIAGAVIAGTLIALINQFLSGEITARFSAKIFALVVIFGTIFGYYLNEIRDGSAQKRKMFAWVGIILVAGSIVGGFWFLGSPITQRKMGFDQRRLENLQEIQGQVLNYWQMKNVIPSKLEDIKDPIKNVVLPADPETDESYIYEKIGNLTFKLCGNFSLESVSVTMMAPVSPYGLTSENWKHPAGPFCFERIIDPKLHELKYQIPTL